MQAWQGMIKKWRQLSITTKFTAAYSFLLLVFFLVSITGYLFLIFAQRKTNQAILISSEIQNLILEMDRDMRNARVLQRDFFMRYPVIGYDEARRQYADPAQNEIARVITLNEELRDVTLRLYASEKLLSDDRDLNLYLAAADRYETTFTEAVDLVTQLAHPETGMQMALSNQADAIEANITELDDAQLLSLFWEMRVLEQTYLLTRQRPYMQSAFNVITEMNDYMAQSDSLTIAQKAALQEAFEKYQEIADEILLIDVNLRSKLADFDLQAQTIIDPTAIKLLEWADSNVEDAQNEVARTSQLATTTLIMMAATGLLAASFIARLLNTSITQKILHLKAYTEAYQAGERGIKLKITNKDELGQLAESFQMMATHTNTLINDLEANVAELQKTEQALRASEQRFQSVFQQAAVGIGILSLTGDWIEVNSMMCNITGYPEHELLKRPFNELVYHEELGPENKSVQQITKKQETQSYVTRRLVHKNGESLWVNQFTTLVETPDQADNYFILILDNITERKQLESQLRQSQKMDAIGQLAGGIAHDFNNLLTVIISYSDLLLLTNKDTSERNITRIQEIKDAGLRAAALTNQLLAFSRRQMLKMEYLNLNDIVLKMNKMLGRLIGENIELVTHLADDSYTIKADLSQVEQVLLNLAINARDAMPQGGQLTIETNNIQVESVFAMQKVDLKPGPYLMLTVSDTGVGIDAEILAKIFEPFFTTKEVGKGTGLGLATVHGIVNQLGGQIWVYSELDLGTSFKIYFPGVVDIAQNEEPFAQQVSYTGDETILLVEDDATVRDLVLKLLTLNGYHVLVADSYTAEEMSLDYAERIDLLLTDVVMPEINGRVLAEQLQKERPEMKVIFMSGYTDDVIVQHGGLSQEAPFLQKPFTANQLTQLIRTLLDDEYIPSKPPSGLEDAATGRV